MAGLFEQIIGESPSSFIHGISKGFFSNDFLRDYQHASKTFRSAGYANSPKYKFLFHVYFDINPQLNAPNIPYGLTVKTVDLPSYTFDTHVMNQYNRKRVIQTKIKYSDINITFHDDNANTVRNMWYNYYTYNYKDPGNFTTDGKTKTSYHGVRLNQQRNIYDNLDTANEGISWGYDGSRSENSDGFKQDFFNVINIYGFNQNSFVCYQLINPIITSFKHDSYDYAQSNGTMTNTMTIAYESVKYYEGGIDGKALLSGGGGGNATTDDFVSGGGYDKTPSPLGSAVSSSIMGPNGLLDSAGGVLSDIQNGNYLGALKKAGSIAQTFNSKSGIVNAIKSDVKSYVAPALAQQAQSGAKALFPSGKNSTNNPSTIQ
jgi:hypothetical protein